ncbi:MAG: primosomal protein N' [Myxococcota bacterium]
MAQSLFAVDADDVARVALPVPVDELFDYAVPAELTDAAQPGHRVQVRFRDRHLTGIVVSRQRSSEFRGQLHSIEKVVDPEPVMSGAMLSILRETARKVHCPIGIALASALPAGSAPRVTGGFAITPRGREALAAGALRGPAGAILDDLLAEARSAAWLRRRRGGESAAALRELVRDGLAVATGVEVSARARAATARVAAILPGVDVKAALDGVLLRAPAQAAVLRRVAEGGEVAVEILRRELAGAGAALRALARRRLVAVRERSAPRDVLGSALEPAGRVVLTADQAAAVESIVDAVRLQRAETLLLHGVTGSGKTEVYLHAIEAALAIGRQALVLVPEIALTHQILARLRGRFGDDLAVLHSGLRPGERLEQWQRLHRGGTRLAIGARSALFAPLDDLGLIVIDEEHDPAYKNDEGFRYHARDLALRRAAAARCPVVLGSATPSLETRRAADRGDIRRIVLAHRIGDRPLPSVEIVDLAAERNAAPRGRRVILSRPLLRAMRQTLADRGQTLLLHNRRGFATRVMCFECGNAWHCEHCDISLVYHSSDQRLHCHYCDYRTDPPVRCPSCGAEEAALSGVGTQRLEEEVRSHFPDCRIERLDRDTAGRRGFTVGVLKRLRAGEIDVLIGTQMIAKGHDYPGVRLVGVVLADIGLHLPDFRAAERSFHLLTQVAGRAGRGDEPGRVVIQTFSPDHYAIRPVIRHDYESFYAEEIRHRAALGYPPFGQLVHAVVSAEDEAAARAAAGELAAVARADPGVGDVELLGPAPCPLARLRGRYRFQLLARARESAPIERVAVRLVAAAAALPAGVSASVDVNPTNML